MVSESQLEEALQRSWTRKTSSEPKIWTPQNPAWCQCSGTTLVVQDYLGGEIAWKKIILPSGRRASHYFNMIKGREIDFTKTQIPEGTIVLPEKPPIEGFSSIRDLLLFYPKVQRRYGMLKERVEKYLGSA